MLCRELAATLARKRPSPLLSGQLESWACGIIRTIGWVNFLGDPARRRTWNFRSSTGPSASRRAPARASPRRSATC